MDIPKHSKFFMFMVLSFVPVTIAFVFFDYTCLDKYKIIKEFYPYSLLGIAILYTVVSLFFRLFVYLLVEMIDTFNFSEPIFETKWDDLLNINAVDAFIYGLIPFFITYYQKTNFIGFVINSLIVWGAIILFLIIGKIIVFLLNKFSP